MIIVTEKGDMVRVASFCMLMVMGNYLWGSETDPFRSVQDGLCPSPTNFLVEHGVDLALKVKVQIIARVDYDQEPEKIISDLTILLGANGSLLDTCLLAQSRTEDEGVKESLSLVQKKLNYNQKFLHVLIRRIGERGHTAT